MSGMDTSHEEEMDEVLEVRDAYGNLLQDGDSVQLVKELKVKGSAITLKKGETVKGIRLTDDADNIECRIGKATIVLKTEFLKKKN